MINEHALASSEMSAFDFSHERNVSSGEFFWSNTRKRCPIRRNFIPLSISNQKPLSWIESKIRVIESNFISDERVGRESLAIVKDLRVEHYGCDLFNLYSNLYEKRYTRRPCAQDVKQR